MFENRKACSETRKGRFKTGKGVLKQEKDVVKQENILFFNLKRIKILQKNFIVLFLSLFFTIIGSMHIVHEHCYR